MNTQQNFQKPSLWRMWPFAVVAGLALTLSFSVLRPSVTSAATAAKAWPVAQAAPGQEVATFAAGCFWSLEAIFKQLKGVVKVEPGYAGGAAKNPSYEQVGTATTGHAETINIIYDPKLISYHDLLEVLFIVHDPTTKNQQGADVGTQYRSAIFTRSAAQKTQAQAMIKKINESGVWKAPIVTQVVPFKAFYRAEDYHLDYYNLHPQQGYCSAVVAPKIAKFRTKFKSKLK